MEEKIAVFGLGYVGLPLAVGFARNGCVVIGYDLRGRVAELEACHDATREVAEGELRELQRSGHLSFTADPVALEGATCIIVCVPTPITDAHTPDLSAVLAAAEVIGKHLRDGAVVVLESTVYPGVTEKDFARRIAEVSRKPCGERWAVGYSPERVNPGDRKHTVDAVTKIVAGMDEATTDRLACIYGALTEVHRAPSIRVAETAKVFENVQRDLGIAAVNELALICDRLEIATQDVLDAAGTKWNFVRYHPGLVGGHCIGVDPYYLAYAAECAGHVPHVLLAGRRVNESMPIHVADAVLHELIDAGKSVHSARVLVLGATFKPNVPDTRNSKVEVIIARLQSFHMNVCVHEPMLTWPEVFGVPNVQVLSPAMKFDAFVFAVCHSAFRTYATETLFPPLLPPGIVYDVTGQFREQCAAGHVQRYRAL